MIREFPEYYYQFKCVGSSCKDSCCIGWELDIDEETYEYYKSVPGEFGDRLRANMKSGKDNTFVLKENDSCPFLNKENLCDIYINLGEESLCSICTEYPRYTEYIQDYMQSDMSLSCMEVGRLLFETPDIKEFVVYEDDYSEEAIGKKLETLISIRDLIIYVTSDIDRFGGSLDNIPELFSDLAASFAAGNYELNKADEAYIFSRLNNIEASDTLNAYEKFIANWENTITCLDMLEVIGADWQRFYRKAKDVIGQNDRELYVSFTEFMRPYENDYSKLFIYFVFRYMIRAYDDNDIMSKIKFSLFSVRAIRALDYARYIIGGCSYSLEDRIDIVHLYSKEVEHSEENVCLLLEMFI